MASGGGSKRPLDEEDLDTAKRVKVEGKSESSDVGIVEGIVESGKDTEAISPKVESPFTIPAFSPEMLQSPSTLLATLSQHALEVQSPSALPATSSQHTPEVQSPSTLPATPSLHTPELQSPSALPATSSSREGNTPAFTEATPEAKALSPLPTTSSLGEGTTSSSATLWDRSNKEQWQIVSLSNQYKNLLKDKLCDLTENVSFPPLVPHLLQLGVLDKQTRDTIQLNATEATQTLCLVEHIQKGPCWRLHSFLRALTLTNQSHIVSLLGLNPDVYGDVMTPSHSTRPSKQQKTHFYKCFDSEKKIQISNDLLPGLLQHCGAYNRTLMKSSIFGHKDTIPIDLTQVWVNTEAKCKQDQSTCRSISKMEMFQKLFQRHPPNTLSLEGPAGAGKSAFMQESAYDWSKDVTACEERGAEVSCKGHLWKLVLYIPLGGIRGTFHEAIRDNLRCHPDLKEQMMTEINKDGDGVLIIGDGADELREQTCKQSLSEYVQTSQETVARPTILVAARDGLLSIPRRFFDRELSIDGYTLQQGVDYMEKYFKTMYKIPEHPVLDYANTHQEQLRWVLTNPLQVHILSELSASGFLTLDDMKTLTTIKLFRNLDNLMVTRDEDCRGEGAGSLNFYRACLRCLINNKREITEEEVGRGSLYLSMLTKYTYRDQDYKERHRYTFPHNMVFEFFAMRGVIEYIKSNPTNKKALLLFLCAEPKMRNLLKLTCAYLAQYESEMFPDTVVTIIRCCLLLQTDIEPCTKNELTEELPTLPSQIQDGFPQELLSTGLSAEQIAKLDRIFDLLQDMFNEPDDCLKKYGWPPTTAKSDFWRATSHIHRFILTCLEQYTQEERAVVLRKTTACLLPCSMHDHQPDYGSHVIPVNDRFVDINTSVMSNKLLIYTWCLQDVVQALDSHKQLLQQVQKNDASLSHIHREIDRLNLTQQYESITFDVNFVMKLLLGPLPAGGWSEEEWTPALMQLLQFECKYIRIAIDEHVPMTGLLSALKKAITSGHNLTLGIFNGEVAEEDLLQFLDWAQGVGLAIKLQMPRVMLAARRGPDEYKELDSVINQKVKSLVLPTFLSTAGQLLCKNYVEKRIPSEPTEHTEENSEEDDDATELELQECL